MTGDDIAGGAVEGGWRVGFAGFGFALVAEGFSFETADFLIFGQRW